MTISAQLPDRAPTSSHSDDRPTAGIDAHHRFVDDSLGLLDHRTRAVLIPEPGAPPGRYLSIEHEGQKLLLPLRRPITHIGRGLIADVRLEDANVSRRHAILALRGEGARVLDDRSSNGTFVNGRQVTVAHLSDGDVLRFGRVVFRYVEVEPRPKTVPLRRIALPLRARRREPAGAAA
jgi:hypothetical protein